MITNNFTDVYTSNHRAFCTLQKYITDKKIQAFLILYTSPNLQMRFSQKYEKCRWHLSALTRRYILCTGTQITDILCSIQYTVLLDHYRN